MNLIWNSTAVIILDFFFTITSFASVYVFSRKNYSAHYYLLSYFLHYFVIAIFSNFLYREMKSYIRRIFFWRVSISINLAPWIFQDTSCIFRYSLILHSPLANENLTSISRRKLNDPQFLALQQPRSKLGNDARSCCCWY